MEPQPQNMDGTMDDKATLNIRGKCYELPIVVGTENGMLYRLEREVPGKRFYPVTKRSLCPNMKRITLEKVLWSLEEMEPNVTVAPEIRTRAKRAVDRMLAAV